jgi:hypothetical protein
MTEAATTSLDGIPQGYLRNAVGHLVPKELISEIDLTRDELVREIISRAEKTQKDMQDFKMKSLADLMAFVELSAEKYHVKMGGLKGNISFISFDGQYKIQIAVAERVVFDERIHAAKEIIDQCIHRWTEGTGAEIRALVEHAFQTDKEGNISLSRILGLTQLKIEDELWKKGIDALRDSMQVAGTNTYMRLYKRTGPNGKYEQISLDMAAI